MKNSLLASAMMMTTILPLAGGAPALAKSYHHGAKSDCHTTADLKEIEAAAAAKLNIDPDKIVESAMNDAQKGYAVGMMMIIMKGKVPTFDSMILSTYPDRTGFVSLMTGKCITHMFPLTDDPLRLMSGMIALGESTDSASAPKAPMHEEPQESPKDEDSN